MRINLQMQAFYFVNVTMYCNCDSCHGFGQQIHGSCHCHILQSTKSEVCKCKLIHMNNQMILDDGDRIIIPQGNFKFD